MCIRLTSRITTQTSKPQIVKYSERIWQTSRKFRIILKIKSRGGKFFKIARASFSRWTSMRYGYFQESVQLFRGFFRAVRASLLCNGAPVASRRRARCKTISMPLRPRGALTARQPTDFWTKKTPGFQNRGVFGGFFEQFQYVKFVTLSWHYDCIFSAGNAPGGANGTSMTSLNSIKTTFVNTSPCKQTTVEPDFRDVFQRWQKTWEYLSEVWAWVSTG